MNLYKLFIRKHWQFRISIYLIIFLGCLQVFLFQKFTGAYRREPASTPEIDEIRRILQLRNSQQIVYNTQNFEPLRNDSIIIVVQVHDRISYLRHLIASLAHAEGISEALLIFSHDLYDEQINNLVQSVNFSKFMQIFYPYSLQVYPHEFPGESPRDCPRDVGRNRAIFLRCTNALFPDKYGWYRNADLTQAKHHWWWKANYIFSRLELTKTHQGLVLFLEEDHYVAEDFFHVLKLMEEAKDKWYKRINVLSLGSYLHNQNYKAHSGQVEVIPWLSSRHNMGMAFTRDTWRRIAECAPYFCNYDDYNWDYSLQHVSRRCLRRKLLAVVARSDRIFHIGKCGLHHKGTNCNSTPMVLNIKKMLSKAKPYLYPRRLVLTHRRTFEIDKKKLVEYGGWGDERDRRLCMKMTVYDRN